MNGNASLTRKGQQPAPLTGGEWVGERAPTLPDRIRLPMNYDVARLRADLAAVTGGVDRWIAHHVSQNYEGDWSVLPLRHADGAEHPIMQIHASPNVTRFVDGQLMQRAPYIRALLATLECPLQAVRLMRLAPGSVIKPHRDHDLAAEWGAARLHLPILTNDQVDFRLNDLPVTMLPGSLWYLRLAETHSVANRGVTERVHLVIDCIVNGWLAGLLKRAAID